MFDLPYKEVEKIHDRVRKEFSDEAKRQGKTYIDEIDLVEWERHKKQNNET